MQKPQSPSKTRTGLWLGAATGTQVSCPNVSKIETPPGQLARKQRVVARTDLPGIPAGTPGKVTFVEGFSWIRYWVRFDNGVQRGSINRKNVATLREWAEIQRRRELGLPDDEEAAAASAGDNGAAGGGAAAVEGEGVVVNGVTVPASLIERTKRRREALGLT